MDSYLTLINALGSELSVLMRADLSEIQKLCGDKVSEGIGRVRKRNIVVEPGYDGKFGVVKIWNGQEVDAKTAEGVSGGGGKCRHTGRLTGAGLRLPFPHPQGDRQQQPHQKKEFGPLMGGVLIVCFSVH